jgi:hypothetical protein
VPARSGRHSHARNTPFRTAAPVGAQSFQGFTSGCLTPAMAAGVPDQVLSLYVRTNILSETFPKA